MEKVEDVTPPVEGAPAGGADAAAAPAVEGGPASDEAAAKKKKKKKKKKKTGAAAGGGDGTIVAADAPKGLSPEMLALMQMRIQQMENPPQAAVPPEEKEFKFWNTQPVRQFKDGDSGELEGPIEAAVPVSEIRQEPYKLPAGFEWDELDLNSTDELDQLYNLLNENYVEDDDNMFRFDYSREFLAWALKPPGWKRVWHPCVRNAKNKKLLAFISAIPAHMRMNENDQPLVEINFLCVHKKLRSHRLAPVLIKEITRRVNCEGIFQASYTAGVLLPKPIAKCRYWHRSLHPKKLIDVRFSHLPRGQTMARQVKKFKLPQAPVTAGMREMQEADVAAACALTVEYLKKFNIAPVFNEEDFKHWLLPRDGVIYTYVVENPETKAITDVISFYSLPSTIVGNEKYKTLNAAYSYYNVSTETPMNVLMNDALILAKQADFDVFNALDLMDNAGFLEELLFGQGDGYLHYYLYNYKLGRDLDAGNVGLVLL